MIYTITLNPALDRTVEVEQLVSDDANRVVHEARYAGGKGIDVSRVIKELGGESVALGFVGGFDGLELEGRLINEGVLCDFTKIAGETRTNIIVVERKSGQQLMLNAPGPEITPTEIGLLFQKIAAIPKESQLVVMSGSVPAGVTATIYAQIITTLKSKGIRSALDADEELLRHGCRAHPDIIKPNIHEFCRLTGVTSDHVEDIVVEARRLAENGIETVLVSMGARGLLGVTGGYAYWAIGPEVHVVSPVGAGDSTLAGFVYGMATGLEFPESLALAAAAGSAAVLTPGTTLCRREDVAQLRTRIRLEQL